MGDDTSVDQGGVEKGLVGAIDRELERVIADYLAEFLGGNRAARVLVDALGGMGVGLRPLVDHLTFRTLDVERRAAEFVGYGYVAAERIEYDDWWARVYRRPGWPPLFIDQAFDEERGAGAIIPGWVARFGDRALHHVAVAVDDIERAVAWLGVHGVACAGAIVGERGGPLRQIFTAPEQRDGEPYTVLELTERRFGFSGFAPPQAAGLMRSSIAKDGQSL
jgi:hypothetical protein